MWRYVIENQNYGGEKYRLEVRTRNVVVRITYFSFYQFNIHFFIEPFQTFCFLPIHSTNILPDSVLNANTFAIVKGNY